MPTQCNTKPLEFEPPEPGAVTIRSERRLQAGRTTLAWISKRKHNTHRVGSKFASARPNLLL